MNNEKSVYEILQEKLEEQNKTLLDAIHKKDKIHAILISLISMSRMVEEERCEIGTLKGLGFSNSHLYFKNLLYSFLATSIGGIIGMFIGFNLIPKVIWNIYTSLFFIPEFVSEFSLYYASLGLIIALVCICGASIITTHNILKEKTSNLMRAKAPKIGKKIFLENNIQ